MMAEKENKVVETADKTAKPEKTEKVEKKEKKKGRVKEAWKGFKSELKKITWFSRKQTFTSTLLVLVCMIISAAFIGAIDFGFSKGIEGLGLLVELFRG